MASDTQAAQTTAADKRKADYAARVAKAKATKAAKAAKASRGGRPVERPTLRPGQALGRDGEILNRRRTLGESGITSEFDLDENDRDPRWERRAVAASVFGKPNTKVLNEAYDAGYRPVLKKHVPNSFRDITNPEQPIERDGLILMERPIQLGEEALADQYEEAVSLRQVQTENFGGRKLPRGFDKGRVSDDGRFDAGKRVTRGQAETAVGNAYKPKLEHAGPGDDD